MTAARTPEEVLAEHPVMWLGDWPGGTTCRRCGVLDVSTTAHQAQALRDAGLLVGPGHTCDQVLSADLVIRAVLDALGRGHDHDPVLAAREAVEHRQKFDGWLDEHDREVAAGAWDQGAHWGFFSTTYSADNPNPYRADRVRRGEGA